MLFGINVSFAGVRLGSQITDPSTLKAGDKILLRAGTANDESADPKVYHWVASLADSMVWADNSLVDEALDPYTAFTLEQAEGTIKDKPSYYVKNDANGLYLTYVYEPATENEDGELEGSVIVGDNGNIDAQMRLVYTSDKAAAAPFVFVLASEGCQWGINGAYTGDQPDEDLVMMYTVCKEYTDAELLVALNQAYGNPWVANYVDWGAWFAAYEATITTSYIDDLNALYAKVGELNYIGGTGPGCYDPALVEAFDQAKAQAAAAVGVISPDEATCEAAYKALEEAWLALAVAKSVPISSGYYKFKNKVSDATNYKLLTTGSGLVKWTNWNNGAPDVNTVWELIDRNDGTYFMRNLGTNQYVSSTGSASSSGSSTITTSKDTTNNTVTFIDKNNGYFVIRQRNDYSLHAEWSSNGGAGVTNNVVAWNSSDDGANSPSQWAFEVLSEDSIEYYKKIGDQVILDLNLADLLVLAQSKYDIGNAFTYDVTKDSLITSPEQFLSNAAQMSTDTLYTNPRGVWGTGADGGGYAALLDGTMATYFHSAWTGTIAEPHYMDIDLGKDVNGFVIAYSKRGNNANNLPKAYEIYTAKADADTSLVESWTLLNEVTDQPQDKDTVYSKGFESTEACRYVRFLVTETKNDAKLNGYVFFSLGGMQVYEAKKLETCFNAQNPTEANALLNAITEARAVKAGETTQEDIDKLQAAYDAYNAIVPDPTELKNAYTAAETIYNQAVTESTVTANGAKIYNDPGTYKDADKAVFKETLDAVKEYIDVNEANGTYTKDGLDEQLAILTAAQEAFVKTVRWFNAADADQEGTWYYIANSKRYFDVTGASYPNVERQNGILYVQPSGNNENKTIYWATQDSIQKQNIDLKYAQWRFINLGDTAYAIQNRGTQLYIGQYQTHPASLSASPVAFKISEIGYGSFTFKGVFFNGEPVANNYLHSQVDGQTLVYWNAWTVGSGSAWDIYTTDANRTEQGELVENFEPVNISFMDAQAGKLYALCYPVGFEFFIDPSFDINTFTFPTYEISSISETELTLSPLFTIEAGQPFFYLANNDQSLLKPNPTAADTVSVTIKLNDMKTFAQQPQTVNGLIGTYESVTVPAGMGYLKETTTGETGNLTSRVQTIASTTKNQTIGKNTAYINAGMVENKEPMGNTITVKIDGSLDTAIKDAIINAQTGNVNVYSIDGVLIKKNVKASEAIKGLSKGLYIIGNTKVVVK